MSGGCTPIAGSVCGASDIDASSGASLPSGGDIARADTHVAAAQTLGVALGIDAEMLKADFTDNGRVPHIKAALVT